MTSYILAYHVQVCYNNMKVYAFTHSNVPTKLQFCMCKYAAVHILWYAQCISLLCVIVAPHA